MPHGIVREFLGIGWLDASALSDQVRGSYIVYSHTVDLPKLRHSIGRLRRNTVAVTKELVELQKRRYVDFEPRSPLLAGNLREESMMMISAKSYMLLGFCRSEGPLGRC